VTHDSTFRDGNLAVSTLPKGCFDTSEGLFRGYRWLVFSIKLFFFDFSLSICREPEVLKTEQKFLQMVLSEHEPKVGEQRESIARIAFFILVDK